MAKTLRKIGFRERWTWYHIAGFALTVVLAISMDPVDDAIGLNLGNLLVGLSMAIAIGLMEWVMLRRYGIGVSWIGCTVAGFAISFLAMEVIYRYVMKGGPNELSVLPVVLGAFLAAIFQYFFILRNLGGNGVKWIALYTLGWLVAFYASMSVSYVPHMPIKGIAALPIALVLIFSGAILLAWITSGTLRDLLEKVPEMPEAEVGKDLI